MKRLLVVSLLVVLLIPFFTLVSVFHASPPIAASSGNAAGWELQDPFPQGNGLNGIWGTSSTDVFAVGDGGTILHYDGSAWSNMDSGTEYPLLSVWGTSSTDVFAVGSGGTILHYDGSAWSNMNSGTYQWLRGVWGTSPTDVFAVGGECTILHYDGSAWSNMNSGTEEWGWYDTLCCVWGASSNDVFAVGYRHISERDSEGIILHYNGSAWSKMLIGSDALYLGSFFSVWGTSPTDVFAVGAGSAILHYNGNAWSSMSCGSRYSCWLRGVWGTSSTDVFAVGCYDMILHYDGRTWSSMSTDTGTFSCAVWGNASNDVFTAGLNRDVSLGIILHYSGGELSTSNGVAAVIVGAAVGVTVVLATMIIIWLFMRRRRTAKS